MLFVIRIPPSPAFISVPATPEPGLVAPCPKLVTPSLLIRTRSVGDAAPSAVVENTRRPGTVLAVPVASDIQEILAACLSIVPIAMVPSGYPALAI